MSPHEVLEQHTVDIQKATADFLEDAQEKYRDSLAKHEKEVMFFDRIALERHDNAATRAERLQIAKHWILRLNADGPQMPLRQRPEFADALKTMPLNARRSLGGNATLSETDTSRTSTTSTTRSAIRRRRKLRLLCRSENWMAVLQRVTGKPAGSVQLIQSTTCLRRFQQ